MKKIFFVNLHTPTKNKNKNEKDEFYFLIYIVSHFLRYQKVFTTGDFTAKIICEKY